MSELWIIGVAGGGAGVAIGGPLLLRGRLRGGAWTTEQLTGAWLVGAAVAMLLVGVRHGGLLSPAWDLAVEHFTNATSLIAWTMLVSLTGRVAQRPLAWGAKPATHLALPSLYLAILGLLRFPDIRFLWLMPVGVACVIAIGWIWRDARSSGNVAGARQAGVVFVFALAFCSAQAVRSLFPRIVEVREIVPAVMTLSFFAIAFLLSGGRAAPAARMADEVPRYTKSSLTAEEADQLVNELNARMDKEGWYRDPDVSLAVLAARVGVAPQTLSQALNQRRRQSLTECLAERRLREAKRLLLDPANDCFTVEGLAHQAGFASRSAFYRMFREAEGITPAQYRQQSRRDNRIAVAEPDRVMHFRA